MSQHSWLASAVVVTSLHTVWSSTVWVWQQKHPPAVVRKPHETTPWPRCRLTVMFIFRFFKLFWNFCHPPLHATSLLSPHDHKPRVNPLPHPLRIIFPRGRWAEQSLLSQCAKYQKQKIYRVKRDPQSETGANLKHVNTTECVNCYKDISVICDLCDLELASVPSVRHCMQNKSTFTYRE